MKKLLPFFLTLLLTNCEQKKELGTSDIKGAYSMTSQIMNDGSKDTVITRKQLKIFTDDHVIYAAMRFPDSLASYGIGTYEIQDGNVIEHFFYSSANGARNDTVTLKIDKTDKGYKQVIEDLLYRGGTVKLTEEYEGVAKADSTPLDGAWKLSKIYDITNKGDSTTRAEYVEFKVYQSGHFIWASSYPDENKKMVTFFGFGKFEMDGNNRSKEVNSLSTYPPIIDTTMNLELEFMGKEAYKQTIIYPDSGKSVEIYERLKTK